VSFFPNLDFFPGVKTGAIPTPMPPISVLVTLLAFFIFLCIFLLTKKQFGHQKTETSYASIAV